MLQPSPATSADTFDVIIVGAGLGGLQCAYILQRHGLRVCVVEKNCLLGGCLQSFRRSGQTFDTGFHYVGGLDDGQMLNKLFRYFGLMELPWKRLDADCFDQIVIEGKSYAFANGYDNFVNTLAAQFPHQVDNLKRFVSLLKDVGEHIDNSFEPRNAADVYESSLFARSAYDFLCETIDDPLLRDVVSGASLKMELNAESLPLYVFAQINSSYIQSAYRLVGGGMQIAETLRANIESMGGVVMRNCEVTEFVAQDGRISAVNVGKDGKRLTAKYFISNAHPATTMSLLANTGLVRKIYSKRISSLANTFGMFTVNIKLRPGLVKYLNKNIYAYSCTDVWHLHQHVAERPQAFLISFAPPADNSEFTTNVDILTPMKWSDVEKWFGTKIGCRGDEYEAMKNALADVCIKEADKYVPNLRNAIDSVYTSTPLTYADYTATAQGSAYGIRKDYKNAMFTVLTPRTPVPNLLLTGQNLNLHGILGVSMTSVFTCAEILGMEAVVNDINNKNR